MRDCSVSSHRTTTSSCPWCMILSVLLLQLSGSSTTSVFGFQIPTVPSSTVRVHHDSTTSTALNSINSINSKATLTEETLWKLRFSMSGIKTTDDRRINELLFVVDANFIEDEGYEPPQGSVVARDIQNDNDDSSSNSSNVATLRIKSGRWQLSEDPEDRKDGLWVWGLFQEPLYPFLLLQLETEPIELPGEKTIAPLKLFAQISHSRDKERGVVLKASQLNIREMETIKADPFGGATVEIYEEVTVGQLSIQPTN